ncbi:hypothetical protein M0R45_035677 [Rubus argutus]|uniref:Uncharacterized protein n=1 Tax=Rubus argutus TaxID=59490 RepID=A0AAW1VXK7_RUBAR
MSVGLQKESSLELFRWVWFSLKGLVLAFTNEAVLSARLVLDALRELGNGATDMCEPQIGTQVSSLSRYRTFSFALKAAKTVSKKDCSHGEEHGVS